MVSGWFNWVTNDVVRMQALTQLGCMPAGIPNTCVRSVVAEIKPLGTNERLVVSWGNWPPTRSVQNIIIQEEGVANPQSINIAPGKFGAAKKFLGGKYQVSFNGGGISITSVGAAHADPDTAVAMSWGNYAMACTLPKATPHLKRTYGLFGYLSGSKLAIDVFRNFDGSPSRVTDRAFGGARGLDFSRQNGPEVRAWAATCKVSQAIKLNGQAAFLELAAAADSSAESQAALWPSADYPAYVFEEQPAVPTPAKEAMCRKLVLGVAAKFREAEFENCMMDADSPQTAASNIQARQLAVSMQSAAEKDLVEVLTQELMWGAANRAHERAIAGSTLQFHLLKAAAHSAQQMSHLQHVHAERVAARGIDYCVDCDIPAGKKPVKKTAIRRPRSVVAEAPTKAQKVAQKSPQKVAQKSPQKVAQKAAQKATQKAAQKVAQKAAQKVAHKAAQNVAHKAAQKVAQRAPHKRAHQVE